MPAIVLFQVLVLGPTACSASTGSPRTSGEAPRVLGLGALGRAPFAVIPLFVDRYHEKWVEQFLPQALGLTAMPDFPSMVLVLLAALLVVRSLGEARFRRPRSRDSLPERLEASNPRTYLLRRRSGSRIRRRTTLACRGFAFALGAPPQPSSSSRTGRTRAWATLPAVSPEEIRSAPRACRSRSTSTATSSSTSITGSEQMNHFREFFWSARSHSGRRSPACIAVFRVRRVPRSPRCSLAGSAAFLVVKGFSPRADIEANTFWRLLMPAWPAYLLLFASIPLLVPTAPADSAKGFALPAEPPDRSRAGSWSSAIADPARSSGCHVRFEPDRAAVAPALVQEIPAPRRS